MPQPPPFPDGIRKLRYVGTNNKPDAEIGVDMLDYSFIDECEDADVLRGIIDKLKSGDEGLYPQLERYAERKLLAVVPEKERRKMVMLNLNPTREDEAHADMDLRDFASQMGAKDRELAEAVAVEASAEPRWQPPVRGSGDAAKPKPKPRSVPKVEMLTDAQAEAERAAKAAAEGEAPPALSESAAKHTHTNKEYFRRWETYDADAEVSRIEEEEKAALASQEERKRRREKEAAAELSRLMDGVDYDSMPAHERAYLATHEKQKGNECFKSGEVTQALIYYSRSIALDPSQHVVYANRALANLREKNFEQAERDCTSALDLEPTYIKALSRRGMTRHRRGKYREAMNDFEAALNFDPANMELAAMLRKSAAKFEEGLGAAATSAAKFNRVSIVDDDDDDDESDDESDDDDDDDDEEEIVVVSAPTTANVPATTTTTTAAPAFVPSAAFSGARPGYFFTTGAQGTGYYRDPLAPAAPPPARGLNASTVKVRIEESDDEGSDEPSQCGSSPSNISTPSNASSGSAAGSPARRITIEEADSSADDDDDSNSGDDKIFSPRSNVEWKGSNGAGAVEEHDPVQKRGPGAPELVQRAEALKREGAECYAAQDFGAAFAKFTQGARVAGGATAPGATEAVLACKSNAAMCLLKLGRMEAAAEMCDEVLKMQPRNVKALVRKATAAERLDDTTEALACFRRAVAIDCDNAAARDGVARLEATIATGKHERQPEPTPEQEPAAKDTAAAMAVNEKNRGNVCFKQRNFAGAVEHYSRGLRTAPETDVPPLLLNRAMALLQLRRWREAEADCDTVLSLLPDNLKARFRRGKAKMGRDDLRGALDDFEHVVRSEPSNAQACAEAERARDLLNAQTQARAAQAAKAEAEAAAKAKAETMAKKQAAKAQADERAQAQLLLDLAEREERAAIKAKARAEAKAATEAQTKTGGKTRVLIEESDGSEDEGSDGGDEEVSGTRTKASAPPAPPAVAPATTSKKGNVTASAASGGAKGGAKGYYPTPAEQAAKFDAAKARNKTAKARSKAKQPAAPKTGYEFERTWRSLRSDSASFYKYLKLLKPSKYNKVFKTGVESGVVSSIIEAIHKHMMHEDAGTAYDTLLALSKIDRFGTVQMLLEKRDKEGVGSICDFLGSVGSAKFSKEQLEQLRNAWVR